MSFVSKITISLHRLLTKAAKKVVFIYLWTLHSLCRTSHINIELTRSHKEIGNLRLKPRLLNTSSMKLKIGRAEPDGVFKLINIKRDFRQDFPITFGGSMLTYKPFTIHKNI